MAMKDPHQVAEKWSRKLGAATEDIRQGVQRVQENPAEQAIAKKDKLVANFNAAVLEGKWERGLRRVSLSDWQNSMINKGLPRIASGAQAAQPKMAAFMQELLPFVESAKQEISDMPDLTLEDNILRMTKYIRRMSTFKRTT